MNTERRSLVVFVLIALVLVVGAIWVGQWLAAGGPTKAVARPGQIAFISDRDGTADVWLMNEDGSDPVRLAVFPGDERETAFSPDGDWIYFTGQIETQDYQLGKVRPNGRAKGRLLATSGAQTNISVSFGTRRVYYISNSQVFSCSTTGTDPVRVLPSRGDESLDPAQLRDMQEDPPPTRRYSYAVVSPRNDWIAAVSQGYDFQRAYLSLGQDRVTATLLDGRGEKVVTDECTFGWSADGRRLALATGGPPGYAMLAVYEPDPTRLPEGVPSIAPVRVLLESRDNRFAMRNPAWSPDGETIVFERVEEAPDGARLPAGLWAVPAKGGQPRQLVKGMVTNPVFSPDGRFLLYQSGDDLMRYDWKSGDVLNLTKGKGLNRYGSWSPVLKGK
ncbi:MAG: hypothetical protein ACUVSM_10850 [Armatimonadota bacterium]